MKRAIGYLRVSTAGQAEHGMGLPAQRQAVESFAQENGYQLLEIVEETASGAVQEGKLFSHEHRPQLKRLVDRATAEHFDVLIVATLDRLSRDRTSLTYLKRLFARYGVDVRSAAGEANGNGPTAELIDNIMAEIADYDRKQILQRLSDGKAQRKRQGQHAHGRIPYGYRSTGKGRLEPIRHERKPDDTGTKDVIEDGEEVKTVRRIFELAARKGYSASRIARELNDERRPSPQGKKWLPAVVVRILRNPIYAGERYGRKGAQPAIVGRRTWNAAQATLDRHRKRKN